MNIDLAAATAQCSRRSLYYWMKDGKLPYTTTKRTRHVRIEDVLQLAKKEIPEATSVEPDGPQDGVTGVEACEGKAPSETSAG